MIWADFLAVRFRRSAPVQSASSIQNRMAHLVADLRTSGTLREIRVSRLNSWREPLGRRSLGASPPAAGQVELGEASRLYGSCGRGVGFETLSAVQTAPTPAAPLIKLKKAPRKLAQRLLSEIDVHL